MNGIIMLFVIYPIIFLAIFLFSNIIVNLVLGKKQREIEEENRWSRQEQKMRQQEEWAAFNDKRSSENETERRWAV